MGPLKHRPQIVLLAQSGIRVGEPLRATVRITVKRRVQIRRLSAEWIAQEEARFGSGDYTVRKKYRMPGGSVDVLGETVLEPGQHEHLVQLQVPPSISPSYSGRRCSTRHMVVLRLHIPWWLDRKRTFELPVEMATDAVRFPGEPLVFASRKAGLEARKPYVEGSLATDVVVPGDVLRGAIALLNTEYNRYTKVTVSLIGTEVLQDRRRREQREVRRLSVDIETRRPAEGESFSLGLRLPRNLAPSASGVLWSLRWSFEVIAKIRLGRDESIAVPITVAPGHLHSDRALLLPAPRVGSARQQVLWQAVAASHSMECFGSKMQTVIDGVSLEIERQQVGRRGWSLIATLRFPSLRLGACIKEASLLKGTGFGGMRVLEGTRARNHFANARSPEQAEEFFLTLAPHLANFSVVRMDDVHLTLERADSGLRRRRLYGFVAMARAVAGALPLARSRVLPPSQFVESTADWNEFAASLGSTVELGDMSIDGRFRGLDVRIGHSFRNGEFSATTISIVGLTKQAAEDYFVVGAGGRCIAESDLEVGNVPSPELLTAALLGATSFSSTANEDVLEMLPQGSPSEVKSRLQALSLFSSKRAKLAGPYR